MYVCQQCHLFDSLLRNNLNVLCSCVVDYEYEIMIIRSSGKFGNGGVVPLACSLLSPLLHTFCPFSPLPSTLFPSHPPYPISNSFPFHSVPPQFYLTSPPIPLIIEWGGEVKKLEKFIADTIRCVSTHFSSS